jgi:hypothetical protein
MKSLKPLRKGEVNMVEPTKKKTLEELAKEVMDTQMGLRSREELDALFAVEEPQTPAAPAPAVEPTPAPTPPTPPVETPVQPVEPVTDGLDILGDSLPEEFKDKDVQTSVRKMAKSYGEIKAALEKEKKEKEELEKNFQSFTAPPSYQQAPVVAPTDEAVEDSMFFERPGEAVAKVAKREAYNQVVAYHNALQKAQFVNNFKAQHADFEIVRPEIAEILQARPDLDKDPANLPAVYNMAKQLKGKRMDALRQQLGLAPGAPPTQPTNQSIDVDRIREEVTAEAVEKAKTIILNEIKQRRSLSGIPGSTTPMTPTQRATQPATEKPKTNDELIFEEMQNSGPKALKLGE